MRNKVWDRQLVENGGGISFAYGVTLTTAGWASEFQQASKRLASGSPSVTMQR